MVLDNQYDSFSELKIVTAKNEPHGDVIIPQDDVHFCGIMNSITQHIPNADHLTSVTVYSKCTFDTILLVDLMFERVK